MVLALTRADSWVGCDRAALVRLRVAERSRAEREGRTLRGKTVQGEARESGRETRSTEDTDMADEEAAPVLDGDSGPEAEEGTEEEEEEEEEGGAPLGDL